MSIDQILALLGLSRLPREPKAPRPLWEENGCRVVLSSSTLEIGPRTLRYLELERLESFVWTHVNSREFLRHPCCAYDSKTQALRKLQLQAREAWKQGALEARLLREHQAKFV
jgi:hypothetical protein